MICEHHGDAACFVTSFLCSHLPQTVAGRGDGKLDQTFVLHSLLKQDTYISSSYVTGVASGWWVMSLLPRCFFS